LYIPYPIQAAQCEQAAWLYSFDNTVLADGIQGLVRQAINVGGVALSQAIRSKGSMMSPDAYDMCKPYLIQQVMRVQRA